MSRARLDRLLVARGLAPTRSRARDLILRGCVSVDGVLATGPGTAICEDAAVTLAGAQGDHVSRGAIKLTAALAHFGFDAADRVALDVGASTGGFTQVLLAARARRVYAVDVGRGQLAPAIAAEARVVSLEGTDARVLSRAHVPEPVEAIVADVSFISLRKALPVPLALAAPGAWLVALIKPQFEAGRAAVGKGGIVRDPSDRLRAATDVSDWLARQPGWRVAGVIESPLVGGSGNREFLLGALRDA